MVAGVCPHPFAHLGHMGIREARGHTKRGAGQDGARQAAGDDRSPLPGRWLRHRNADIRQEPRRGRLLRAALRQRKPSEPHRVVREVRLLLPPLLQPLPGQRRPQHGSRILPGRVSRAVGPDCLWPRRQRGTGVKHLPLRLHRHRVSAFVLRLHGVHVS